MSETYFFKMFGADFLTDDDVSSLPLEEQALLVRIWCLMCKNGGEVTTDPVQLCLRIGVDPNVYANPIPGRIYELFGFFEKTQRGTMFSNRMKAELEKQGKRSEAGRKAVKSRWNKRVNTSVSTNHDTKDLPRRITTVDTKSIPQDIKMSDIDPPLSPLLPESLNPLKNQSQNGSNGHHTNVWEEIVKHCHSVIPDTALGEGITRDDIGFWFRRCTAKSLKDGVMVVDTASDDTTEPHGLGKFAPWIREARLKHGVTKIEFLLQGQPKEMRVKPRPK